MKQVNLWLSPEELKQMLQGSLQWNDVASRMTTSKMGIRKLSENFTEKHSAPIHSEHSEQSEQCQLEKDEYSTVPLEGQPVVWLLGSVALLTLSSWFYFVLFAK